MPTINITTLPIDVNAPMIVFITVSINVFITVVITVFITVPINVCITVITVFVTAFCK